MRLPEPLFVIINPMMRMLLQSPLHWLVSSSLMLITFKGRRSGRTFVTPVRYVKSNGTIRCFSSSETQWWRNLRNGVDVVLRVKGENIHCRTTVIEGNPERVKPLLSQYLSIFPQDAAYHAIRLNPDKSLVEADLDAASKEAIVVEARPNVVLQAL
jgi:hypothetical protein